MESWSKAKYGFLGAGKMATALARGWLSARLVSRDRLAASDPSETARHRFAKAVRVQAIADNVEVVRQSDVVVLAVKPQHAAIVLEEIAPVLDENRHLLISIVAGLTLGTIRELVGHDNRVVRVMPNTAVQVRAGACAYAPGLTATPEDRKLVEALLSALGRAFEVPESLLDAVTGLSGSGPAFVYLMIEALSDGGVRMGLPRDIATEMAAQTVLGAATMALRTGRHPGQLKDEVTSPGGTTIAGLQILERSAVRAALIDAVQAATEQAHRLAQAKDD